MKETASRALFYNESEGCRIFVRGDDFDAVGGQAAMNGLDKVLRQRCELRITRLFVEHGQRWQRVRGQFPQSSAAHRSFRESSKF